MSKPELRSSPARGLQATWWRQATQATTYWRCTVPARRLPGQVLSLTETDAVEDSDGAIRFPWQRGAAIWQFVGNRTRFLLMRAMQKQGTPCLLEVDDNYLAELPAGAPSSWRSTIPGQGEADDSSLELHRQIVPFFNAVICSTEYLAERYRAYNERVFVCPNSIEPDDWPTPDKPQDGVLRIGWAASASHAVDQHLVRRALGWASQQPKVEVVLYGLDPGFDFRYRHVPWTDDLAAYRASLAQLDVGLCPLIDHPWTRGKSDVKALEYAMAGAMSVCSDVEPYREWRLRPAMMARSGAGFRRAVEWCVRHPEQVAQVAASARAYVLRERTIQSSIYRWREAIDACAERPYFVPTQYRNPTGERWQALSV